MIKVPVQPGGLLPAAPAPFGVDPGHPGVGLRGAPDDRRPAPAATRPASEAATLRTSLIGVTSELVRLAATLIPGAPVGGPSDDQLARAQQLLTRAIREVEGMQLRGFTAHTPVT